MGWSRPGGDLEIQCACNVCDAMRRDAMLITTVLLVWYGWYVLHTIGLGRTLHTHIHVKCVLLTRPSTKKNLEKFEKSRKMDKKVKIKEGTWSGRKGEEGGRH